MRSHARNTLGYTALTLFMMQVCAATAPAGETEWTGETGDARWETDANWSDGTPAPGTNALFGVAAEIISGAGDLHAGVLRFAADTTLAFDAEARLFAEGGDVSGGANVRFSNAAFVVAGGTFAVGSGNGNNFNAVTVDSGAAVWLEGLRIGYDAGSHNTVTVSNALLEVASTTFIGQTEGDHSASLVRGSHNTLEIGSGGRGVFTGISMSNTRGLPRSNRFVVGAGGVATNTGVFTLSARSTNNSLEVNGGSFRNEGSITSGATSDNFISVANSGILEAVSLSFGNSGNGGKNRLVVSNAFARVDGGISLVGTGQEICVHGDGTDAVLMRAGSVTIGLHAKSIGNALRVHNAVVDVANMHVNRSFGVSNVVEVAGSGKLTATGINSSRGVTWANHPIYRFVVQEERPADDPMIDVSGVIELHTVGGETAILEVDARSVAPRGGRFVLMRASAINGTFAETAVLCNGMHRASVEKISQDAFQLIVLRVMPRGTLFFVK